MTMEQTEAGACIEAGKQLQVLKSRVDIPDEYSGIPVALDSNGDIDVLQHVLSTHDKRAARPRRRKGTATLTELESFIAHVERNKLPESVVFAAGEELTVVYNYNPPQLEEMPPASAAWGDHRAVYTCPLSDEWIAWSGLSGVAMGQEQLANFLDEHEQNIVDSDECRVIELVQLAVDLQVYTKGEFIRKKNRTTGACELVCKTEHSEDSTRIPPRFKLSLPVFVGGQRYEIFASLQLRVQSRAPEFTFKLLQAAEVKRGAFLEIRKAVAEATGLPVFAGSPEM